MFQRVAAIRDAMGLCWHGATIYFTEWSAVLTFFVVIGMFSAGCLIMCLFVLARYTSRQDTLIAIVQPNLHALLAFVQQSESLTGQGVCQASWPSATSWMLDLR